MITSTEIAAKVPTSLTSLSQTRRFFLGMSYPLRGTRFLLRHTHLWPWAAAPLLLTIWAIFGALWVAVGLSDDALHLFWPRPDPGEVMQTALWQLLARSIGLLVFVVSAVVLWVAGNMIASPFWDVLAEKSERLLLDRPEAPFDWRIALADAWMSIRHSALALLLYVLIMGPLLLLNLIPGLGTVLYTLLSWTITVLFVARELMDVPLSRRRTPFVAKLVWIRQHRQVVAGLGTTCTLMLAVPGVNLFVMPLAVMGATLLYCHLDRLGQGVPQRGAMS